jgi:hypothetical protein
MKLICTVLGLALFGAAAAYFTMPANSLPNVFPGYDTGLTRMRYKHGIVSAVLGVVALAIGWFTARR